MKRIARTLLTCLSFGAGVANAQSPPVMPNSTPTPTATSILTETCPPATASASGGWKVNGGASLITIAPRFESNPAYITTSIQSQGPNLPTLRRTTVQEFEYDYKLSSRVWLGIENENGAGVRARWWQYHQSAPTLTVTNNTIPLGSPLLANTIGGTSPLLFIGPQTNLPAVFSLQQQGNFLPPDTLTFGTNMSMNVFDLDATYSDLSIGKWTIVAGAGIRYAKIKQQYSSYSFGVLPQSLVSDQTYNGIGPTIAVDARRPICDCGLAIYGGLRGALLFGTDKHSQYGTNLGLVPPFALNQYQDSAERKRMLPAIESEMGLEYNRAFGQGEVYFQGGVVAQLWPSGSGANGNGNMGLIGFSFNAGVRY